MTTVKLDARITRRAYAETRRHAPSMWWCSFATNEKFLGVAIVEAVGDKAARRKCRALGIDPGGEMLAFPAHEDEPRPPKKYMNRLFSETELNSPEMEAIFSSVLVTSQSGVLAEIIEDVATYVVERS